MAKRLAATVGATHLRIDTLEQALRDLCGVEVTTEGYEMVYRIAADQLELGLSVVGDSCNPVQASRQKWRQIAHNAGVPCVDIEVVCSDPDEHRTRVEARKPEVPGLVLPTWTAVVQREVHPWTTDRVQIDTAGKTVNEAFATLLQALERAP